MDHRRGFSSRIFTVAARGGLALAIASVLTACEFSALDEAVRGRAVEAPQFESLQADAVELVVATGSYGTMGSSIGRATAPTIEEYLSSSSKARSAKSAESILGGLQADAGSFSRAMTSAWTDMTGVANEINAIGNAIRTPTATLWNAVDMGYEAEIGASGFVWTNGQQALLAKAVGTPLSPYLGLADRLASNRPQIRMYHPNAGLSHMIASWPLAGHPVVGVNKRGLAISVTATMTDSNAARTAMPFKYRSILQTATSVPQAMRNLYAASQLDTPATVMLADRSGEVAHIECSLTRCVEVEVIAQQSGSSAHGAHHITSLGVSGLNNGTAASQSRLKNLEAVLAGSTSQSPSIPSALDIMRSVAPTSAINDNVVANSQVSAVVIVDPRRQSIWHSTGDAPFAAFSKVIEVGFDGPTGQELPAVMVNPASNQALSQLAQAEALYLTGQFNQALMTLDQIPMVIALDRRRQSYFRALVLSGLGQHQEAADFAATAAGNSAQSNLSVHALMLRAWNLNKIGDGDGVQRAMEMAARVAEQGPVDRSVLHALRLGSGIRHLSEFPTLLML